MNGALVMTNLFRPAVVLALGLLVSACGGGGPSLPGSSPAPLPGPPQDLNYELTPLNEVLLTWAPPAPEPRVRAPVTHYEVWLEGEARPIAVTGSLSYLYQEIVPGRTYVFHVRAVNRVGRSAPAGSVTVTVVEVPLLPPAPPSSLTADLTPNDEAILRWAPPPPAQGRAPVTEYVVYRERSGGGRDELGKTQSLSYVHPVTPGENYVFTVRASSDAGLSDASASVSVNAGAGLVPNPPGNLVAVLTSDRDVLLTWSAPATSPEHSPVTGYKVFLETLDGASDELGRTSSLSYRHSIPGTPPRRRHVFYVRAVSAIGDSQPSQSVSVEVPPVVVQTPAPPGDFTAVLTPNNDALLEWTAPEPSANRAPFTKFEIWHSRSGMPMPTMIGTSLSLSYLDPDLERGETHVYFVRAASDVGTGRPSQSATIDVPLEPGGMLPPSAPEGFVAELTPNNDVQFVWTAPESAANRIPVKDYLVYEVRPGGGVCPLNSDSTADCPAEPDYVEVLTYLYSPASDLVPGQRYTYFVRARSVEVPNPDDPNMEINLLSPPSVAASVDVSVDPLVPLSIPHLTVRADQSGGSTMTNRVTISWVHSLAGQLQSVVTGFELQHCNVVPGHEDDHCPGGDWQAPQSFGSTVRTHTDSVTCVSTATTTRGARMYRIRAIADNPSLSSRYSVPTRPICPGSGYSAPRRVDAVFAADPIAAERVNICWGAPEDNNSPLLGYELQATTGTDLPATEDGWVIVDAHIEVGTMLVDLNDPPTPGDTSDDTEVDADPACRLYSGLVAEQQYWFRVRAYNLAGHGHWSAPYHYRHGLESSPPLPARASVQDSGLLSVADARASERTDASLTFEVTLDRPASSPVTVDYATADGTATAGNDYTTTSGTLELAAGETSKTIAVAVLADTEDEGEETLVLRLSNPAGARIEDGEATGTILDRDPLPKEWLARFGRTVAAQAVDAVGTRLVSEPRTHARVGGVSLESSASPDSPETLGRRWADPARNPWDGPEEARGLSRHALMSASSFHLASEGDGPVWAAWGRFAAEGFEADVHDTRLDGDTTTGFLGADVAGGRWLMGAAVSHSEADGSMVPGSATASARERSDVESTLTGVYPYARMTLSERVSLWGLAGVGQGTLTVSERGRAPAETDIGMNMGALGARGTMLAPSEAGGVELALRSDAFWVRMSSDEARTAAAGDLADIGTDASRVRLFLEAVREFEVRGEGTLTPSLEVGVRRDGGDAETGTGFEAGAGMRYAAEGIAIEGAVRKLVTHEDSGYREWGAGGSVRIDPGASGRGLSLTLAPAFGAGSSDAERLWSLGDARSLAGDAGAGAGSRLEAEVGYGWWLPIAVRGMLTPYTGLSFSDRGTRAWRLGARLMMTRDISFGLEGTRREHPDDVSDQSVVLHGRLHW